MPLANVRDLRMYYELQGNGARLLYVGGSNGDLRRKPNIFDSLLGGQFSVLAYDQRGLGQTDKPAGGYTMADYAADAAALLDAAGWQSCMVFGVSFGGMVAQEVAIRYPERVTALVLACSSSGGKGGKSYPIEEFADLPVKERLRKSLPIQDSRRDPAWQESHTDEFDALVAQSAAANSAGGAATGMSRGQLAARAAHDTYDRLPALKMPVFICGGRYDGQAPPANQEAIHAQVPGSRLEFFEGGHLFLAQDPRAYEQVVAFLKGDLKTKAAPALETGTAAGGA
jgi:3-oxoadipate enol-lactonase